LNTHPGIALANLSVTVTDMRQVVKAENEGDILRDFPLSKNDTTDLPTSTKYRVEDGIDISGRFVTKKGNPAEGILSVLQKNSAGVSVIPTTPTGNFIIEGLQFYDSIEFVIQAESKNGGKPGVVILDTMNLSPAVAPTESLRLTLGTQKQTSPYGRWVPSSSMKEVTLMEVTVEGKQIQDPKTAIKRMAYYTISGDWLRSNNISNILIALQGRVPGLHIYSFFDGHALSGQQAVILEGRHVSFFKGSAAPKSGGGQAKEDQLPTQEALVLINDVVVSSQFGDGARALSMLRPEEIDRIEIYKSNGFTVYGVRGNAGVISVYTKNPVDYIKQAKSNLSRDNAAVFKIAGFATPKKFESPDYSQMDTTLTKADYRSTIYWNPSVHVDDTGATVSFFAADNATKYRIVVEGVTNDGMAVRGEKIINIKTGNVQPRSKE
jgi:hypothetical protein